MKRYKIANGFSIPIEYASIRRYIAEEVERDEWYYNHDRGAEQDAYLMLEFPYLQNYIIERDCRAY